MSDDAPALLPRKRLWPRFVAIFFVLAAIGAGIGWFAWPQTTTATALFDVGWEEPSLAGDYSVDPNWLSNFEIFKKTQVALLKSNFVMAAALRDPSVAGSPIFAGVSNPEEWLQDHLKVSFPEDGQLLAIELKGPTAQASDLCVVVDAVAGAYSKEVVSKEKQRKLAARDLLDRSLQNLNAEIKRKYEDYIDIAKGMGRTAGDVDPEMQIDMKHMDRIEDELTELEREQLRIDNGGDSKDSAFIKSRVAQLHKSREDVLKSIQRRSEKSVDLTARKSDLERLQRIADVLSEKLEKLDIDSSLPDRIRLVQPAVVEPPQVAAK